MINENKIEYINEQLEILKQYESLEKDMQQEFTENSYLRFVQNVRNI